ncbi:phenazine biosynthesis protein PhzF family [Amphritea atlantica]|uniref:Phenazine biosynthesis protein PhzF family n=1 Tax=Amphritea atlantica TaxID=355243 RepID=A0A1H9HIU8_9GAMM|nr:PhzF family phenazine biosynthesis protein [Amphritea atlantica]SEQ62237.1 phenazine biosynthesis protein PhzF family [Amphritea atlantica]
MKLRIFQVDAFTDTLFGGNPAAVCPLKEWLSDALMQQIAMENSVAETAFFVPNKVGFEIRWFTPEIEMDLCGHATLAAAHVITKHLGYSKSDLIFQSTSGKLPVKINNDLITLIFPSRKPLTDNAPQAILDALHIPPIEVLKARDYLLVFDSEADIRSIQPNRNILDQINLDPGGIIVTAKGDSVDFVSRFFTPQASILEDPVTGSAHCSLIPYWAEKLSRNQMTALQLSSREGTLFCQNAADEVHISGKAVTYMEGIITI